ncbi:MAG: MmcQ/YjbR family DNA-binding protein [Gemella sp.]|nr:MmcQ/YjbR family DNA-binding protein [Gemella sp.]
MLEIERIFHSKKANIEKLIKENFVENKGTFTRKYNLENKEFHVEISIKEENIKVRLFEKESGEEYTLIHSKAADGLFVNSLREEIKVVLENIAEICYENKGYKDSILKYVKEEFDIEPVYLWEKHPEFAVLRTKEKQKWIGLVMTISKEKLGLVGKGRVEAINLKAKPEEIEKMIDGKNYLPAYHMNKKHWLTIVLDENISQDKIRELIKNSYNLVVKK